MTKHISDGTDSSKGRKLSSGDYDLYDEVKNAWGMGLPHTLRPTLNMKYLYIYSTSENE